MRLRIREFVNNNALVVTWVSLLLLGCSLMFLWKTMKPPEPARPPEHAWFADATTGRKYIGSWAVIPPDSAVLSATGEPAGVRVYVLGCGGCAESERYDAFWETYTMEAKLARQELMRRVTAMYAAPVGPPREPGTAADGVEEAATTEPSGAVPGVQGPDLVFEELSRKVASGRLVSAPAAPAKWVQAESEAGQALMMQVYGKCAKDSPQRECFPEVK